MTLAAPSHRPVPVHGVWVEPYYLRGFVPTVDTGVDRAAPVTDWQDAPRPRPALIVRVGLAAHEVFVDRVSPEIRERPTSETEQTVTWPEAAISNLTVDLPDTCG